MKGGKKLNEGLDDYLKNLLSFEIGDKAEIYEIEDVDILCEKDDSGRINVKVEFSAIDSFGDLVAGIEFEDDEEFEPDEKEVRNVNFGDVEDKSDLYDIDFNEFT